MIEVRHLKLIQAVAEVGTLKNAAERLFLTQSALSHQLKELEVRLGTPVFHRVNHKLLFTPAGKELLDASQQILARLQKAERSIQELNRDCLKKYIHGYSPEEAARLNNQANSIAELLHWDTRWLPGSLILEAGCGIGAQTRIIAPQNPECNFVSIDLAAASLTEAEKTTREMRIENVTFEAADILHLPYQRDHFDHIFVCFAYERWLHKCAGVTSPSIRR